MQHTLSNRQVRRPLRIVMPLMLGGLALALAGCGTGAVKQSEVEQKAAQALAEQIDNGVTPNISCPDDLKAEEGATLRCELSVDGEDTKYGVTVTAASVDGDQVNMTFKVDEQPLD